MIHGQNTYPSLHGNQNLNFFEIRPESCLIGRCRQTNFVPLVFCETIIRQLLVSHKKAQFLRLKTYCNFLSEKDYYEVYASHQKKNRVLSSPFFACDLFYAPLLHATTWCDRFGKGSALAGRTRKPWSRYELKWELNTAGTSDMSIESRDAILLP